MSAMADTGDKLSFVTPDERKNRMAARRLNYDTWSREKLVEHMVKREAWIVKLTYERNLLQHRAQLLKKVADLEVGKADCLTFSAWLRRELEKEPPETPSSSCNELNYETWTQEKLLDHILQQNACISNLAWEKNLLEDRAQFLKIVANLDVGKADWLPFNMWLKQELSKVPPS